MFPFAVADLGGEGRAPPLAQNVFIFMQFSGKIGQIIGWRPPFGVSAPPLGNPGSATALSFFRSIPWYLADMTWHFMKKGLL